AATSVAVVGWFVNLFAPLASLAVTWLLLILLYLLLPNARVKLHSAIAGAFVGAVLWELSKLGFGYYVTKAVGYSALYGSLGLVPLFLLWLYLTWLAILFGLEVSYVVQTVRHSHYLRNHEPLVPETSVVDPAWAVPVAAAVATAFDAGQPLTAETITEDLELPGRAVLDFVAALTRDGVLRPLGDDDEEDGPAPLTLGRPAEQIHLADLLKTGYTASHTLNRDTRSPLLTALRQAAVKAAGQRTLRDLLDENEGTEGAEGERGWGKKQFKTQPPNQPHSL
ncbi:MAG: YihY/virulence factor BrkB family protein, partial [Algisphaera sp.]